MRDTKIIDKFIVIFTVQSYDIAKMILMLECTKLSYHKHNPLYSIPTISINKLTIIKQVKTTIIFYHNFYLIT